MIVCSKLTQSMKGAWIQQGDDDFTIEHLLTDSRKLTYTSTSVFFPLVTSRRNAHDFLKEVYQAGVRCFVVSQDISYDLPGAWIYRVENTLSALQQLAAWHRSQFNYPVIGITGSNGKTIVKEMLFQLLESQYQIVRSPRSFNSQLGVPLSVWQMGPEHQMGIFEAGISQAGEMEHLEKIIKPEIGIFTNIGETHNEGFFKYST